MEETWLNWTQENLQRGCDPQQILGILLKNNFTLAAVRKAMGDRFPVDSPLVLERAAEKPEVDHAALTRVWLTTLDGSLGVTRHPDDRLQLYSIEHFLSPSECDELIGIMNTRLRASTVTVSNGDPYFRTSSTSDLSLIKHPAVSRVDRKIAQLLGIRLPYSEGIQAQKYEVGQEFKPHTDYFRPGTPEYDKFGGPRGNRTWTFMVYLNDTARGGGTRFVNLDQTFHPRKGYALAWNNLYDDGSPNADTLHCGLPVEEGEKYIITKWFRERGSGAMFADA